MSITSDFGDLFVHQVTHEPFASRDAYGKVTYGASTTYRARVDYHERHIVNSQGITITTRGTVIFGAAPDLTTSDRITLPSGEQPPILEVKKVDDLDGSPYYSEATFG